MAPLSQLAQQLVSISNVTAFQNVVVQHVVPFKPPASAIRINVTWLLSLLLSLTQGLSAAYPLSGLAQYHRARRNYPDTLHGIERSRPPRVVDSMPTLLRLSIFLFIAGLIDFLLLTNQIVALCVLGYVSAFSFACLVFTALSSLHPTSLPEIAWRISLIILLAVLVFVVEIGGFLYVFLSSIWNPAPLCAPEHPSALSSWRDALESQIRRKQRSPAPADGLRQSIDLNATTVQSSVDASPVHQTLSALDPDQKIKNPVARIPGVLGSNALPCTTFPILSSMEVPSGQSMSDPIFGSCYHDLLDTLIPDTSALTEESRGNGLPVRASPESSLWYCGRAYHRLGNSAPLSHYVRDVSASPEMTRRIQNEPDPTGTACIIGRCFASLIAKKVNTRFSDAELASLSAILGSGGTSGEMMDRLDKPGLIGPTNANIISLSVRRDRQLARRQKPHQMWGKINQRDGRHSRYGGFMRQEEHRR